jgi:hypothetical protein
MIPASDCSDEEVLAAVVQQYFRDEELAEAHRLIETGHSYEEAIASLASSAEDSLRNSGEKPYWFFTIPSGRVSIYRPGHSWPERPLYRFQASYLATLALPAPIQQEEPEMKGRQLSFWDESEIAVPSQVRQEERPKKTRTKKLKYIERPIAKRYGHPQQGFVVKDAGLGYVTERMGEGYLVTLIHLKSRREMASVIIGAVDHERIREWVSACVPLTDWNKGIQALLAEKQGKQKQLAWSRQLEAIWYEQKRVKRQIAFF